MWTCSVLAVAQSASPATADALAEADGLYRSGNWDSAIARYQAILQQDPKAGAAWGGLARSYLRQEKVEQASEAILQGVRHVPGSNAVHTALGEVYFRQGKMLEAETEFVNVINSADPPPRAYLGLARLARAYSQYRRAKHNIELAHQLDPADPDIGRFWTSTLKLSERIKNLEAALAATSEDSEQRERLQHRLEVLKERQAHPQSSCQLVSKMAVTEAGLRGLYTDPKTVRGYGLSVKLNGKDSVLLLDTGAGGITLSKRIADLAGIKPVGQSWMTGIGDKGPMASYIGYADSVKIGKLEFQHCLVEVSEKRSVVDEDGLIGADVFSSYLVTLDFPDHKLRLAPLPRRPEEASPTAALATGEPEEDSGESGGPYDRYVAPEMKGYTKVFRFGHSLLIPAAVDKAAPALFLIDTGSYRNHISPELAKQITSVREDPYTHVRGISGDVKRVYSADKAIITFAHLQVEAHDLLSFDLSRISAGTGTEVSGILGFHLLEKFVMTLDYRDGLVDFQYDASRWHEQPKPWH